MAITSEKIALDSMIFIYLFDSNHDFVDQSQHIISLAEQGKTQIITSIISILESLSPVKYQDDPFAQTTILNFFHQTPNLKFFDVDIEISTQAAQLRRENKSLRTPDSIQLATALVHQANIFITHDTKLTKLRFPHLKIIRLDNHGEVVKS